jgi:mono/diheme cytochrome c family protein
MRSFVHLFAVLTLLSLTAAAADHPGKAAYDKSCKACHGLDGAGNPGMAKMLKVTMRALGSAEVQKASDADLKKVITDGTGKMKPVAGVAGKQADDLVAYLRTLKK